jgi:hypothetical protein
MPDQPLNNRIVGGRVRVNPAPAISTNDDERDLNVDASGNLFIGGTPAGALPVSVTITGGAVTITGPVTISGAVGITGTVSTVPATPGLPSGIAEDEIALLEVLDEPLTRLLDNLAFKVIQDTPGDLHTTVDALPAVVLAPGTSVAISGPVPVQGAFFQPLQSTDDPRLRDALDQVLIELRRIGMYLSLLVNDEVRDADLMEVLQ